jgi:hypothetical protein
MAVYGALEVGVTLGVAQLTQSLGVRALRFPERGSERSVGRLLAEAEGL